MRFAPQWIVGKKGKIHTPAVPHASLSEGDIWSVHWRMMIISVPPKKIRCGRLKGRCLQIDHSAYTVRKTTRSARWGWVCDYRMRRAYISFRKCLVMNMWLASCKDSSAPLKTWHHEQIKGGLKWRFQDHDELDALTKNDAVAHGPIRWLCDDPDGLQHDSDPSNIISGTCRRETRTRPGILWWSVQAWWWGTIYANWQLTRWG